MDNDDQPLNLGVPYFLTKWCFWAIHVSLTKFGNPCHHRGRYRARSRVAARSLFFWIPSNTKMSTLMGRWRWTMRLWGSVFSDATCWVYLGGLQLPVSAFYGWFKALQSQVIEFEEGSSHKLCRSHTHCVGFLSGFPWTRSQRNCSGEAKSSLGIKLIIKEMCPGAVITEVKPTGHLGLQGKTSQCHPDERWKN